MQPRTVGHHRVDEGLTEVDPAPGGTQHPLDQVGQRLGGQDGRGQLGTSPARNEDLAGLVHPDLFDLWIVQIPLQRAETGDLVQHRTNCLVMVTNWR